MAGDANEGLTETCVNESFSKKSGLTGMPSSQRPATQLLPVRMIGSRQLRGIDMQAQAQAQSHAEPLPEDYLAWQDDYSDQKKNVIFTTLMRNPRAVLGGGAGLLAVLLLAYWMTGSSEANVPPPRATTAEKTAQPVVRSSNDLDALRAAFSEQNATNQQIVAAIDALRAEQHELRKQITAMQSAKQSAGITTGSITPRPQPKPLPAKKPDQADARHVPYPAQVPYPSRIECSNTAFASARSGIFRSA